MKEKMQTEDLIRLWSDYQNVDKVFFHNPIENKSFLAAISGENINSEILFYAFEFFDFENSKFEPEKSSMAFQDICVLQHGQILIKNLSIKPKKQEIPPNPSSYTINQQDYGSWQKSVQDVVNKIKNNELEKLVLSQKVEIVAETNFSSSAILLNLFRQNPKSFIFAHCKNGKTFLGASPELLVAKSGANISSYALAGTMAKDGKNDEKKGQKLLLEQNPE